MLCANARLEGHPVAVIANRRGFLKPRIGGIIYTETARKVAYFVELANRAGTPIIYVQDVSGFMVGSEAESEGIIRAGAEMVEAMSCAERAAHRSDDQSCKRRGLLRDGWSGLRSELYVQLAHGPNRRDGRRFGGAGALLGGTGKAQKAGAPIPPDLAESIQRTRADYERWLDAKYAAARGHCDALIDPKETREVLALALEVTLHRPRAAALALETL